MTFSARVLAWYARAGRHNLPWVSADPYRVWVSEIMLQQTQVEQVKSYYARFMARFPTLETLAAADLGDVLAEWAGLGYYARARNLHRAARQVGAEHGGLLPRDLAALCALPGIGRSTAGAILALAHGDRAAILDANVRRVLARFHGVRETSGSAAWTRVLWQKAEQHLPHTELRAYTQGLMDLGALVCTPAPQCGQCPLEEACVGRGEPTAYPGPRGRRPPVPQHGLRMLILRDGAGKVLLLRRPPTGLWGGLWGLPECGEDPVAWCRRELGLTVCVEAARAVLRHRLTHRMLLITPQPATLQGATGAMEKGTFIWYNLDAPGGRPGPGMATPVRKLLQYEQAERRASHGTHGSLHTT